MLNGYLPAIVFVGLGTLIGLAFAVLNTLFGPRRAVAHKSDPYDCGLPSEIQQGFRFGISFYLIAMLFILFDIEVIFLYPVAIQLRSFGMFAPLSGSAWIIAALPSASRSKVMRLLGGGGPLPAPCAPA